MLQSDVRKVSAYKAEMQEIIYSKDIMEDNEMTKVDIISGFLGAGKTTLIAKLLKEAFPGEQVVLIENEFGKIGIDGGFLKESGVEIREMNSGCICCSLVGDFGTSLKEVVEKYHPDRIIIEPSGVGKLSDVIKAVKDLHIENEIRLNSASTVADASKVKVYMKNFGEFFNNQIEHAGTIILSRTQNVSEAKLKTDIELIRSLNKDAHIITTPWDDINGKQILDAMENVTNLELEMLAEAAAKAAEEHEHEHHHDHDGECGCGHDHDHEHEHHHDHDGECGCGHDHDHEHEHHHDHDGECSCGHDHHHEHEHESNSVQIDRYHEAFNKFEPALPDTQTTETVNALLEKHFQENFTPEVLKTIHGCIDLTSLTSLDTKENIWKMVDTVNDFEGTRPDVPNVAAICVYPLFVETVKQALTAQEVKIASVAGGFPSSQTFTEVKIAETAMAVMQGADEIDVVMNLGYFMEDNFEELTEELQEIKESCRHAHLKVILETGALVTTENIQKASILAMYSGADFIKTSTGKGYPGATFEAAYTMCKAIKTYHSITGNKVGIKISGGVRTAEDAVRYYTIVKEILGDEWLNKDLFRIGASSLVGDIEKRLGK